MAEPFSQLVIDEAFVFLGQKPSRCMVKVGSDAAKPVAGFAANELILGIEEVYVSRAQYVQRVALPVSTNPARPS